MFDMHVTEGLSSLTIQAPSLATNMECEHGHLEINRRARAWYVAKCGGKCARTHTHTHAHNCKQMFKHADVESHAAKAFQALRTYLTLPHHD